MNVKEIIEKLSTLPDDAVLTLDPANNYSYVNGLVYDENTNKVHVKTGFLRRSWCFEEVCK